MKHYSGQLVILPVSLMLIVGCTKDMSSNENLPSDMVHFLTSVPGAGVEPVGTRSTMELKDETGKTILSLAGDVNDMPNPTEINSTKSTLIDDSESFSTNYGSFWVSGFSGQTQFLDINKLEVVKPTAPETVWTFKSGSTRMWPTKAKLEFFAWAPTSTTFSGGQAWATDPVFSAGNGSTATATISSYAVSDPETQADILLGYYYGYNSSSAAEIKFSHPLTAIKFVAGDSFTDLKVNSIELVGIPVSGTCVSTLNTEIPTHIWSGITTGNWKKDFGSEGIDPSELETKIPDLITIPAESFGSGAKLIVTITSCGVEYKISSSLSDQVWEAGKKTTYKLQYPGTPAITVDDTVAGNIKKNIVIKNTGDCTAWIRAAIVGYWCDVNTDANMRAWISTSGTFVLPDTTNWEMGADGFWYYKNPVPANTETPEQLFTSYACPTAPETDLYLKMFIVVQSVRYDEDKTLVTKAWGNNTPITK